MRCPVCNKEITNNIDCPQCGCTKRIFALIKKQKTMKELMSNYNSTDDAMSDIIISVVEDVTRDLNDTIDSIRKKYWETMPWFVIQDTVLLTFDIEKYSSFNKEYWGEETYYGCGFHDSINIQIPHGITEVADNAFANVNISYLHLELPDTVQRIGNGAFFSSSLHSINIPNGIVEIGAYSFCNNNITNLFLPASVEKIGGGAFSNAFYTTGGLTLHCNNNFFRIDSDCLIENSSNSILSYVGEDRETIVLPYGVVYIADYAFAFLKKLKNVMTFSGMNFSENAFYGCGEINAFSLLHTLACKFNMESSKTITQNLTRRSSAVWRENEILYIYNGNIRCHRYDHDTIQTTAILHNKTDDEIELNVEYCTDCKKFILEYTLFEQYRNRYGVLVGNFRMVVNGEFDGEYDLAEESPLMLSGYNVSQKDGYTSCERHYILARIIHDGIMDKGEVIRYLSYFIRKNGVKRGNELALSKWEEDLAFVQEYDISIQPRVIISDVKKY